MTQPPEEQRPPQGAPHDPPPPPQPYQPYAPQQPSPYPPSPGFGQTPSPYRQKSGSGRTVAIVVGIVVVVLLAVCGGIVAFLLWFGSAVKDAIDDIPDFGPDRPGGRDNPLTVAEGEAFEIDGVEYAAGWRIEPAAEDAGGPRLLGLEGTNDRDDETSKSVNLVFTFVDAENKEIGEIGCDSDGTISHGNTEELTCTGTGDIGTYDHVEVNARY